MSKNKLYIIYDDSVEDLYYYEDLDGFRELAEDGLDTGMIEFENESEVSAFLRGLYCCSDERSPAGFIVLCEGETKDDPFIKIIKDSGLYIKSL